ncbi:MAG: serine protease [Myxococcota bacterium]|nr:serine protease [Myxococcota bacterium]MDW8363919.1 serine protease [Myxococcales bacterium]
MHARSWGAALLASSIAFASGGSRTAAQAVRYGAVDAATVEVFAYRTIGVREVPSAAGRPRVVATLERGRGSGVLVGEHGVVLTARGVVAGARRVLVVAGELDPVPATVIYEDGSLDLALLALGRVVEGGLPWPQQPPALPAVRQELFAVGFGADARATRPDSTRVAVAGETSSGLLRLDVALAPATLGGPVLGPGEAWIGIAVGPDDASGRARVLPLGRIEPALRAVVLDGQGHVQARALMQSSAATDEALGRLVVAVGRLEGASTAADVAERVDAMDPERMRALVREHARRNAPPDVLLLGAAVSWNHAIALLERAGVASPDALADASLRERVQRLMRGARGRVQAAFAADDSVVGRSRFAARLLDVDPTRAMRAEDDDGDGSERRRGARRSSRSDPLPTTLETFALGRFAFGDAFDWQGLSIGGSGDWRVVQWSLGDVVISPLIGLSSAMLVSSVGIGYQLCVDIGIEWRLSVPVVTLLWTPGLYPSEDNPLSGLAGAVRVGLAFERVAFGVQATAASLSEDFFLWTAWVSIPRG